MLFFYMQPWLMITVGLVVSALFMLLTYKGVAELNYTQHEKTRQQEEKNSAAIKDTVKSKSEEVKKDLGGKISDESYVIKKHVETRLDTQTHNIGEKIDASSQDIKNHVTVISDNKLDLLIGNLMNNLKPSLSVTRNAAEDTRAKGVIASEHKALIKIYDEASSKLINEANNLRSEIQISMIHAKEIEPSEARENLLSFLLGLAECTNISPIKSIEERGYYKKCIVN